ncbi:phytanoyl-CoA dioxygenase family protein [Noviherbaspirillum aerium]|uniref:phytanoyl-CoA dioxygenase family protein n=1 Tax=Noviherbaspirillum aerium TaxID=2588497 RepID=UPI00124D3F8C|nr:phytanoyl-CoA dioxygenase family protein [Noviherbaspirillum aerium]
MDDLLAPHAFASTPLGRAGDEAFWRALNPDLHISAFPLAAKLAYASQVSPQQADQCTRRMLKDGYFETPPLISKAKAARLASVISDLVARGIAPVFAFIYDEFWQIACGTNPVLTSLLGNDYHLTPCDIWAWHIDASSNAAGWGPHRDLAAKEAMREDGRPRLVTVWAPLTDTTPLNACMYVLPVHCDPNIPDALDRSPFSSLGAVQGIRAVPAVAGSAIGWNMHVLHWGGRSSEWAQEPRISVALYFHSQDCRLNDIEYASAREGFDAQQFGSQFELPFANRLRAIAGAIGLYSSRLKLTFPDTWEELQAFADKYIGG